MLGLSLFTAGTKWELLQHTYNFVLYQCKDSTIDFPFNMFLAAGAVSLQKASSCHSRLVEPSAISPSCENSGSHQHQIPCNLKTAKLFLVRITTLFHIHRRGKMFSSLGLGFVIWHHIINGHIVLFILITFNLVDMCVQICIVVQKKTTLCTRAGFQNVKEKGQSNFWMRWIAAIKKLS